METTPKAPKIRIARVTMLATTLSILAVTMHSLSANVYYKTNLIRLQTAADIAVSAGAFYLPAQPQSAIQVADTYARANGVQSGEIEFTEVSSDGSTLRMRLRRNIPFYVMVFAIKLPSSPIRVTASAHARATAGHFLSISWTHPR